MNFLAEEVLATASAEVQDFLLRTAIVDHVCAPLADALLERPPPEGSGVLLARLTHAQIPLESTGDDGRWFRYHPLFRSLLLHQLALRRAPTALTELHGRAGAWFATHGLVDEALRHLLAAGDPIGAARLVEDQTSPLSRAKTGPRSPAGCGNCRGRSSTRGRRSCSPRPIPACAPAMHPRCRRCWGKRKPYSRTGTATSRSPTPCGGA